MLDLQKQPAGPETVLIGVHILSKKGDFTTVPSWFLMLETLQNQSVFTDHTLAHPLNCRGGVVARLSA